MKAYKGHLNKQKKTFSVRIAKRVSKAGGVFFSSVENVKESKFSAKDINQHSSQDVRSVIFLA